MSIKDIVRKYVISDEPHPAPSGWDRLDGQTEDFNGDARAEVTEPKR